MELMHSPNTAEGGNMSESETQCRAFTAEFGHLPNVRQAIALAEAGSLDWSTIEEIFRSALAEGLAAVR